MPDRPLEIVENRVVRAVAGVDAAIAATTDRVVQDRLLEVRTLLAEADRVLVGTQLVGGRSA